MTTTKFSKLSKCVQFVTIQKQVYRAVHLIIGRLILGRLSNNPGRLILGRLILGRLILGRLSHNPRAAHSTIHPRDGFSSGPCFTSPLGLSPHSRAAFT